MPIGGCGLGQLMMNDVLDNFLYKWRNYLKSKGMTECSSTDGSEKMIQVSSFLLMQWDLRKREEVFLTAQTTTTQNHQNL